MSTTNVLAVPPNISEGLTLLAKRLLPAKLKVEGAEGKKNGFYFTTFATRENLALSTMPSKAIADAFYRAVQEDCVQPRPQLIWDTPPKALLKRVEQNKNLPAKVADPREASSFEEKSHAADEALKQQKIQDQAKKVCQELVERFTPVNHRRGTVKFDLQAEKKSEWNARIAEAKNFTKLEAEIRQEQKKIYEALERAAERV